MPKLITDYLKRPCSAPLSTKDPSSSSTVETSSSSQRTESNVQTSRTIQVNEEKSINENNESIPVQCQSGPDYSFPMKQFGKKKKQLSSLFGSRTFAGFTIPKKRTQFFVCFP